MSRVYCSLDQVRLPLHIYQIEWISIIIHIYLILDLFLFIAQIQMARIYFCSRWLCYLLFIRLLRSTVPSCFISVLPWLPISIPLLFFITKQILFSILLFLSSMHLGTFIRYLKRKTKLYYNRFSRTKYSNKLYKHWN